MPIYFNREGDHDHNDLLYALSANLPILKYLRALAERGVPSSGGEDDPLQWHAAAVARAEHLDWPVRLPTLK